MAEESNPFQRQDETPQEGLEFAAPELEACLSCGHLQTPGFKYCVNCGVRNQNMVAQEKKQRSKTSKNLSYLAWYNIICLVVVLSVFFANEYTWAWDLTLTVVLAFITIIYAYLQPSVFKLLRFANVDLIRLMGMLLMGVCTGILVNYLMDSLNRFLGFYEDYMDLYLYLFLDRDDPMLYAVILVAVFPAIFEELAYRGFIYNNILNIGSKRAALLGSTFLFALIHLSLLSLIWLIPFALILGYYRQRYNTLYYGMALHFAHNSTIVAIEYITLFGWQ